MVKTQWRTRETFMSALSNKSFSPEVCAEGALLNCRLRQFVLLAQRLKTVPSHSYPGEFLDAPYAAENSPLRWG